MRIVTFFKELKHDNPHIASWRIVTTRVENRGVRRKLQIGGGN
jgi:hypothetical protein